MAAPIRRRVLWLPLHLLYASLLVLLAGCLPARSSYYSVSATEGEITGDCGTIGKRSSLSFKRGDTGIEIPSVIMRGDTTSLSIYSAVPPSDVLRLDWGHLQLINEPNGSPIPGSQLKVEVIDRTNGQYKVMPLQPGVEFTGNAYPAHLGYDGKQVFTTYRLGFEFPAGSMQRFALQFPDVWVNGMRYPGFLVHYQWTTGWWLQPANC